MFHKTDWDFTCTLHSNLIPPTDGTNGLLRLVAYISQASYQCFPACFCHPTVGNFDVSPYDTVLIQFSQMCRMRFISDMSHKVTSERGTYINKGVLFFLLFETVFFFNLDGSQTQSLVSLTIQGEQSGVLITFF